MFWVAFVSSCSLAHLWVNVSAQLLSHVQLSATPWTVACQAPLSMRFFRQEYESGLPFPSPAGTLPDSKRGFWGWFPTPHQLKRYDSHAREAKSSVWNLMWAGSPCASGQLISQGGNPGWAAVKPLFITVSLLQCLRCLQPRASHHYGPLIISTAQRPEQEGSCLHPLTYISLWDARKWKAGPTGRGQSCVGSE